MTNLCPVCAAPLEPVSLPNDLWKCRRCDDSFRTCFFCRAAACSTRSNRCANAACARKGVEALVCPTCHEWSVLAQTVLTDQPACANERCTSRARAAAAAAVAPGGDPASSGPNLGRTQPLEPTTSTARPTPAAPPTLDELLDRIAAQSHFEERYELHARLHEGGMGEIWSAHDRLLGRNVAVKRARPTHVESAAARGQFLKEAKCGARLLHPNILPVLDLGVDHDRRMFYTMRYVEGASMRASLDSVATGCATGLVEFPLDRVVDAFLGVCRGMDFAHQRNILHLDLKPDNVLMSGFEEVFLVDWGLAMVDGHDDMKSLVDLYTQSRDEMATRAITCAGGGRALGTPGYMAPEQWLGEVSRFGRPTDVFGLGGILYYILCGRPPCLPPEVTDIAGALIATQEPQRMGRLRLGILPRETRIAKSKSDFVSALTRICLKALEREPKERYPRVEDLILDLLDALRAAQA